MSKFKKILAFTLPLMVLMVVGVAIVHAQGSSSGSGGGGSSSGSGGCAPGTICLPNPLAGGNTSLFGLIRNIVNNIVLPIGGVLCTLAFIYTGFLYVVAQGSETKIGDAHKALLYTSIGTAILLGSWVLANAICKTIEALGTTQICF